MTKKEAVGCIMLCCIITYLEVASNDSQISIYFCQKNTVSVTYLNPTVTRVGRIIIAIIMITLYMLLKFGFSEDKSAIISTAS